MCKWPVVSTRNDQRYSAFIASYHAYMLYSKCKTETVGKLYFLFKACGVYTIKNVDWFPVKSSVYPEITKIIDVFFSMLEFKNMLSH